MINRSTLARLNAYLLLRSGSRASDIRCKLALKYWFFLPSASLCSFGGAKPGVLKWHYDTPCHKVWLCTSLTHRGRDRGSGPKI